MDPSKNMQYMTIQHAPYNLHFPISPENVINIFNAAPSLPKSYPRLCRKTFGGKHRTATQNDINEFLKKAKISPILILAHVANTKSHHRLDDLCNVINSLEALDDLCETIDIIRTKKMRYS